MKAQFYELAQKAFEHIKEHPVAYGAGALVLGATAYFTVEAIANAPIIGPDGPAFDVNVVNG